MSMLRLETKNIYRRANLCLGFNETSYGSNLICMDALDPLLHWLKRNLVLQESRIGSVIPRNIIKKKKTAL